MTIKELAKELNRQPGTLCRWVNAMYKGRKFGARSKIFPETVEKLRKKSAGARRLKRENSALYAGGLQQSLKLDGDNQAARPETCHNEPGGRQCKHWFYHLPPQHRDAAKRNTTNNAAVFGLYRALEVAFDWDTSPEGFEFWHEVQQAVKDKTAVPKYPSARRLSAEAVEPPQPARFVSVEVSPQFAAYCGLLGMAPEAVLYGAGESLVVRAKKSIGVE